MQTVLARIWILIAVSISYDDNHYTNSAYIVLGVSVVVVVVVPNEIHNI